MEKDCGDVNTSDTLKDVRSHSWFWCHHVILDMGLSVYEIAVYCALARHADGSGKRVCFPSYRHLSTVLGCSRPRAVKAVHILIQKGLLKKTRRSDQRGCHSNLYELVDPFNATEDLVNEVNQGDQNLTTPVNQIDHPDKRH